jgi:uncharacterized protein YndB with AHSA1/START domain
MSATLSIVVRRIVKAPPTRVFEAWTTSAQLRAWWGPRGVTCNDAAVDLRVGGRYRIGNLLPDGKVIVIEGGFEIIEPPSKLVYTWQVDGGPIERVTVRFEAKDGTRSTEVVVVHDGIRDEATKRTHEQGWLGCLDGLEGYAVT